MLGTNMSSLPDLSGLPHSDWLHGLEDFAEREGYFETLGHNHTAMLLDRSETLLVTFETIRPLKTRSAQAIPLGFEMSQDTGWSSLCILAHRHQWYRDPAIYAYFDRLVDDGFFEEFERVVFYGEGMGAYAAAAFSVVAPGSTVVLLSPQATLDPRVAEWDTRFFGMRRVSFTDRYGYAPDMIGGANRAFVLYDPDEEFDAMHASLFQGRHITRHRCRHLGPHLGKAFHDLNILEPLLQAAGENQLTSGLINKMLRSRRLYPPYLSRLLSRLLDDGRYLPAKQVCEHAINSLRDHGHFSRQLSNIDSVLP